MTEEEKIEAIILILKGMSFSDADSLLYKTIDEIKSKAILN